MNRVLKSLLKTAAYVMDQYSEQLDRASDRVSGLADRGRNLVDQGRDLVDRAKDIVQPPNHALRNVVSFAAGLGVGIGAGILLAPASGREIRGSIGSSIKERVQDIRGQAV